MEMEVNEGVGGHGGEIYERERNREDGKRAIVKFASAKVGTTLDFAGLQDIGSTIVPEPSPGGLLAAAAMLFAVGSRQPRSARVIAKIVVDAPRLDSYFPPTFIKSD
jgi:hypothetical protein